MPECLVHISLTQAEQNIQDSLAESGHGTMPFTLNMGVTLSSVRDEYARLSVFDTSTTRDVKLTYLSDRRGHLV